MPDRRHGLDGDARAVVRRRRRSAGLWLLLALTVISLPACHAWDRRRYSLVIRKPAHQYRDVTELEKEELELYERTRVSKSGEFHAHLVYQPFRPFSYCRVHDSYHIPESLVACVAAPIEYPAAITGDMGTILVTGIVPLFVRGGELVGSAAVYAWESIFPPSSEATIERTPEEDRRSRND